MAVRLRGTYYSDRGSEWQVTVIDSDYVGSIVAMDVEEVSVQWVNDDQENRFSPILGSEAKVRIVINTTALNDFVDDLKTAHEGRFQLSMGRVTGFATVNETWNGYVLADLVTVDDLPLPAPGYIFELKATDGVARLKTIPYNNAGSPYTGRETFTKHLLNCLNKLDFVTDRYGAADTVLNVICNWHSTVWTYAATLNPLDRTRTDHKVFLEIDRYGNYNYFSCYDVIKKICVQFGARFIYSGTGFWFVQVGEYQDPTAPNVFTYRKDGTQNSNGTADLTVSNTNNDPQSADLLRFSGAKLRYLPPLRQVNVLNRMYDVENLAPGETWDQGASSTFTIEGIDHNSGNAALSIFLNLRYATDWNTGAATFQPHWFVWKLTIKIGTYYLVRPVTITAGQVVYGNVEWTTSAGFYYVVGNYKIDTDLGGTTFYYNHTIQLITPSLPVSGDLDFQVQYDSARNDSNFDVDGVAGYLTSKTWTANNAFVELLSDATPTGQSSLYDYSYTNTANTGNSQSIEIFTDFSAGRLTTRPGFIDTLDDTSTWINAAGDTWQVGNDAANLSINNLLAREVIRGQITPVEYFIGASYELLNPNTKPLQPHRAIAYDSAYWVFMRGRFDIQTEIFTGDWFKVQDSTSFNREATVVRPPGSTGSGGAVGGGANPVGSEGSGTGGSNTGTTPSPGSSTGTGGSTGSSGSGGGMVRKREKVTSTGVAALPAVSGASLPSDETLVDVVITATGQVVDYDDYTVNAATGVVTLSWAPASGEIFTITWLET